MSRRILALLTLQFLREMRTAASWTHVATNPMSLGNSMLLHEQQSQASRQHPQSRIANRVPIQERTPSSTTHRRGSTTALLASIAVPASSLEQGLSRDEREVVRVVREAGPSVAFVTSILTRINDTSTSKSASTTTTKTNNDYTLPPGRPLGSGSAFVVDSDGYLCTNYHVIEFAYQIQQAQIQRERIMEEIRGNLSFVTNVLPPILKNNTTITSGTSWIQRFIPTNLRPDTVTAQVYVRIDSKTKYQLCRIVDVYPDLDIAVLKVEPNNINNNNNNNALQLASTQQFKPMTYGSSSNLLVGQQLIAIGNPFGLDNTVTTGVVSALNRELQVGRPNQMNGGMRTIRNCIQSDCAINPGNSGGPLLNRQGQVVGVNTAIVTTSGSSAGIGFAVPSDLVQPIVQQMIRKDMKHSSKRPAPYLGVQIINCCPGTLDETKNKSNNITTNNTSLLSQKNWITSVQPNSPAAQAGMRPLRIGSTTADGRIEYGDAIVAIGGNAVSTFTELQRELDQRIVGEQITVTLEDQFGQRRVVYLTLTAAPGRTS